MLNIFSVFSRSALYANLTPGERAFLRFLSVLLGGAFLAGVQAVAPMLSTMDPTTVPWTSVAHTFLAAFALAVWLGIGKYRSAQGDPPLPSPTPLPSSPSLSAPSSSPSLPPVPSSAPSAPSAPPASTLGS